MKISLLLTPRLVVILSACASAIVLLLLMLGFELGLRQAHEDQVANAKTHGQNLYGAASVAPANTANTAGRSSIEPAAPTASRSAP
ncbi:MAG: hypothetical protein EBZ75_04670 [Oxalobacteraceae bacterium]|nr:hypothetical protein [Oxalobacteraceae bacterium]